MAEGTWVGGGTALLILNLGMQQMLYLSVKSPWYPFSRRVGLKASFGTFEKGKPWLLGFPSHDCTIFAALDFVV